MKVVVDVTENDLRRVIREELAAMFTYAGIVLRRPSLQFPCLLCKAGVAKPCEHYNNEARDLLREEH